MANVVDLVGFHRSHAVGFATGTSQVVGKVHEVNELVLQPHVDLSH